MLHKTKKVNVIPKDIPVINKATRKKDELKYKRKRLKFIANEKSKDPGERIFCIFCGKVIRGTPSLHHYDGRDNSNLLDESKWLLSHNRCHVFEYHSMSWKVIPWWEDYLYRIKDKYPELYKKELIRMQK
jgi:hypothetical protein